MERKSCCGSSYVSRSCVSTTKKEPAVVTPKKEEDVKPEIPKGNDQAAVPATVVKPPKVEEKEPVKAKFGSGGCN